MLKDFGAGGYLETEPINMNQEILSKALELQSQINKTQEDLQRLLEPLKNILSEYSTNYPAKTHICVRI